MRISSIIFKVLFILSCAFGLFLTSSEHPSLEIFLSYFTTQSNILCLVTMIIFLGWLLFGKGKNARVFRVLKSLTTVAILVTFLIYHFLLRPNMDPSMLEETSGLGNIFVHYITPLWFFADYLIFDLKGASRSIDPLYYAIFPLYYFVFANFHAVFGDTYHYGSTISEFPYPFLDYEYLGIYGVSVAVLMITLAVVMMGFVFIALDHIMKKPIARYDMYEYGAISEKPVAPPVPPALSPSSSESVTVTNTDVTADSSAS